MRQNKIEVIVDKILEIDEEFYQNFIDYAPEHIYERVAEEGEFLDEKEARELILDLAKGNPAIRDMVILYGNILTMFGRDKYFELIDKMHNICCEECKLNGIISGLDKILEED